MTYAIIGVGGKQYRVREGEWLLVDRVPVEAGKTFTPNVLLVGGDGEPRLGAALKNDTVTALVTEHLLGEKVIVGKHRQRTGYRRRNGHRSRLSRIEIRSIGQKPTRRAAEKKDEPVETPEAEAPEQPKPAAEKKPRASRAKKDEGTVE